MKLQKKHDYLTHPSIDIPSFSYRPYCKYIFSSLVGCIPYLDDHFPPEKGSRDKCSADFMKNEGFTPFNR